MRHQSFLGREASSPSIREAVLLGTSVISTLRSLALVVALAFFALAPAARGAGGFNVDFVGFGGAPSAGYGAASGQAGSWNLADRAAGFTPLVDLSGGATSATVNVSNIQYATSNGLVPTNDTERLLNDSFLEAYSDWRVNFQGLTDGAYYVYLYAPSATYLPTGVMSVGGSVVSALPGDPCSTLIEGMSWVKIPVTVSGGTLAISGTPYTTAVAGLAGIQLVPFESAGFNVDFDTYGVPGAGYGAASGQTGTWNPVLGGGFSSLVDLSGAATVAQVFLFGAGGSGNGVTPTNDDERLLNDNFSFNSTTWHVGFSGLLDGAYLAYLYAPSHPALPTGSMTVGGTTVASIPGDPGSTLIEGMSWVKVPVTVTGGTLDIFGPGSSITGLSGIQLVPRESAGINVDLGTNFGVPTASYGAASGMAGTWNMVGIGVTALVAPFGAASSVSVNVVASSEQGFGGGISTEAQLLLSDNIVALSGTGWSASFSGLLDGPYQVFLYASSNANVTTGSMLVGGVSVASIVGDLGGTLIEGTSWVQVPVVVNGGSLAISGISSTGTQISGLAGIQLVPLAPTVTYCTSGFSAIGCQALICSTGIASATASSGFTLEATGVEGAKDGLFFFGTNGRQANSWGNGTSFQCVVPPVKRAGLLTGTGTPGACDGFFSQDLNARWTAKPAQNPGAGAVVQAQLWYRDPFNTSNQTTSFSNAIEFVVRP